MIPKEKHAYLQAKYRSNPLKCPKLLFKFEIFLRIAKILFMFTINSVKNNIKTLTNLKVDFFFNFLILITLNSNKTRGQIQKRMLRIKVLAISVLSF